MTVESPFPSKASHALERSPAIRATLSSTNTFTAITPVPEPDSESSPLAKRLFYEGEGKTLRERALEIAAGITRHPRASA